MDADRVAVDVDERQPVQVRERVLDVGAGRRRAGGPLATSVKVRRARSEVNRASGMPSGSRLHASSRTEEASRGRSSRAALLTTGWIAAVAGAAVSGTASR
nr:hypothetical protein GCM10025732_10080 [Glycomyces mayteni]